ncbi:MAG: hypothetical protein E7218_08855 [Anaerofustis stercorihominis]|nr:hypothetical protein [Anaerofustis stercorihominis]
MNEQLVKSIDDVVSSLDELQTTLDEIQESLSSILDNSGFGDMLKGVSGNQAIKNPYTRYGFS